MCVNTPGHGSIPQTWFALLASRTAYLPYFGCVIITVAQKYIYIKSMSNSVARKRHQCYRTNMRGVFIYIITRLALKKKIYFTLLKTMTFVLSFLLIAKNNYMCLDFYIVYFVYEMSRGDEMSHETHNVALINCC